MQLYGWNETELIETCKPVCFTFLGYSWRLGCKEFLLELLDKHIKAKVYDFRLSRKLNEYSQYVRLKEDKNLQIPLVVILSDP